MSVVKDRFLACPLVWPLEGGDAVAVFLDRDRGEAVVQSIPGAPEGGWRLFPMNALELLAWLRDQRARGVTQLLVDPDTTGSCVFDLVDLLDRGRTLGPFRLLADLHEGKGGPS
jgi:hypothetical protein